MIQKHWNLLAINESLKKIFNCQPIAAFRGNKNLKELIESNKIEKNKVKKRQIQKLKPGKCFPCLTNLRSLCCKQVRKTTTFKSQQTKKICNCASSYVIYLMGCILCNKQYVGKVETSFNISSNHRKVIENNHRKDVKKVDAIMACKHFQQESHNLNKHAKFIIIDLLTNTYSKIRYAIPESWNLISWDLINSKPNNYNKRLLNCIRLSNIRFSPLQLGHHRAEK